MLQTSVQGLTNAILMFPFKSTMLCIEVIRRRVEPWVENARICEKIQGTIAHRRLGSANRLLASVTGKRSSDQFKGDLWSAPRAPQQLLVFNRDYRYKSVCTQISQYAEKVNFVLFLSRNERDLTWERKFYFIFNEEREVHNLRR